MEHMSPSNNKRLRYGRLIEFSLELSFHSLGHIRTGLTTNGQFDPFQVFKKSMYLKIITLRSDFRTWKCY